ncbi:MAG: Crp/Fnr family transcriptional regulator [Melioribacteraceae bacterium]|nr:Crp/Fnr family transcriptional regulator [Melioribacteraceae bacterium]MCF8355861.1 Crp/Fnr family transcriptional regulator [Melioribacteraceae bacterium]MCF8393297.1 Crp/Fnr family transcriptional regulator [Melioribacteraceae bacterium]MCF8419149.1 Crp/Fnr family transcriptional regulator [Melioribacteraceae bacterium]
MAEKSKLWYLENFNLFSNLDKDKMMELNKLVKDSTAEKNIPIYFASEPSKTIYFLKTGRVKISKYLSDGSEKIIAIINPGEVFGEMAFFDEDERTEYAITLEPSLICAINKNDFSQFVEANPALNLRLTKLFGLKLKNFSERVEDLIFKDADHRIVSFIIRYAEKNGKKVGDQIFVKPFLKHQNIGQLTACSRQTVNYLLTDLRTKGIIDFDRSKLTINKMEELKKMIS